jgi:hypothetical protein
MRAPWASADKQPEVETAPERRVTVILDERAGQIADVLQDALGVGFHVVAFPPADDVIAWPADSASPDPCVGNVAAHAGAHRGSG